MEEQEPTPEQEFTNDLLSAQQQAISKQSAAVIVPYRTNVSQHRYREILEQYDFDLIGFQTEGVSATWPRVEVPTPPE